MLISTIRIVRATVVGLWLVATLALLALVTLPHVLPHLDRQMFIVRGASMEPALPIGSAIFVQAANPSAVASGDIVTFKAANDTIVTHRVVDVAPGAQPAFQTKGDASSDVDALVVLGPQLLGRVEYMVPGLGQVLVVLDSTVGTVAAISLLGGLLLAVWFLDELLVAVRRPARGRAVVAEPAH